MKIKTAMEKECQRTRLAMVTMSIGLLVLVGGAARAQAPLGPAKTDSPVTLEQGAGFLLLDLTRLEDKTRPVIRLGYQSFLGDKIRRMRAENPDQEIQNVPYYSINLAGTPSGDVANIFSGGKVSTGADVQVSFGQAYLLSYVTPLTVSAAEAHLGRLISIANEIETEQKTLRAERAKDQPDQAAIHQAQNRLADLSRRARNRRRFLEQEMDTARQPSQREAFRSAIDYATAVIAYAEATAAAGKPAEPDPTVALGQRGGAIYDAWFVRLGLNAGSATFFDASKSFGEQFRDEDYNGYSAQLGYSIRFGGNLPFIVAFSGGMTHTSNVDELSSVEVTETQSFASPDGVTKRGTTRKRTGLVGELEQETNALAKFDMVLYPGLAAASRDGEDPKSTIALDLFGRAERGTRTIYGVGAYITKPGSPTSVYGGVNAYRAENGKLAVGLVAGFPF